MSALLAAAIAFAVCPARGERVNCVVDGDSVWIDGQRVRLLGIDAPEMQARCPAERELALRARQRLAEMLSSGSVTTKSDGPDKDRYGRLLRRVFVEGVEVGPLLVSEGLARIWVGRREPWC